MNLSENQQDHILLLQDIARRAMLQRGLLPDFPANVQAEADNIPAPQTPAANGTVRDLRDLLWASIDNDDSLDLDQLTVAEALRDQRTRIRVAVADVDSLVPFGSAIDEHASHNTTSIYTAAEVFPMLPVKLSNDFTSLNPETDRLAVVTDMVIDAEGHIKESAVYRAVVRNHAKLAYNSVAAWLDGEGPEPEAVTAVPGLAENIRLQQTVAEALDQFRQEQGALNFQTIEAKAVFEGNQIVDLQTEQRNCAKLIIEVFMISANTTNAKFLESRKLPSIRRVVRKPKRWDRIVDVAAEYNFDLPRHPNAKALNEFLLQEKEADPLRFPDLSLTIIKLLGSGEYVAEKPGLEAPGHFGLAVKDYTHSTAPNRRYPDLITQRLLKATLENERTPYTFEELETLAEHLTKQEDIAAKVERQVNKSAAALLLKSKIGQQFDAFVTGAAEKGTWVRLIDLPVEGKLVRGFDGLDVGDRVTVELISVNVELGYIDFAKPKRTKR